MQCFVPNPTKCCSPPSQSFSRTLVRPEKFKSELNGNAHKTQTRTTWKVVCLDRRNDRRPQWGERVDPRLVRIKIFEASRYPHEICDHQCRTANTTCTSIDIGFIVLARPGFYNSRALLPVPITKSTTGGKITTTSMIKSNNESFCKKYRFVTKKG